MVAKSEEPGLHSEGLEGQMPAIRPVLGLENHPERCTGSSLSAKWQLN